MVRETALTRLSQQLTPLKRVLWKQSFRGLGNVLVGGAGRSELCDRGTGVAWGMRALHVGLATETERSPWPLQAYSWPE